MQGVPLTTQEKQKFLAKLKPSNGTVAKACRAINISRQTAYEHRKHDADFSAAWDDVIASVVDEAERELYQRAVKGEKRPDGTYRKSDRLLEFFLKGNRAEKYRERMDVNNHHSGSVDVNFEAAAREIYGISDSTSDAGSGDADRTS